MTWLRSLQVGSQRGHDSIIADPQVHVVLQNDNVTHAQIQLRQEPGTETSIYF